MGLHRLLKNEEVREIVGCPGYFITSLGRVLSIRPLNGKGDYVSQSREVKPLKCSFGRYLQFGADKRKILIHRQVAEAFIGHCPDGYEVSHINGNSHDNRLINLEYKTHSENERMKKIHGTSNHGEANTQAKLTKKQVEEIKEQAINGPRGTLTKLAKKYGVSVGTISMIKDGKRW